MIVNLFKHGSDEFVQMLEEASIEYEERRPPPGVAMNAPSMIEIIQAVSGLAVAPALAAVIVQWLKNKAMRKIIITDNNGRTTHLEGYSVKEVEVLLPTVQSIQVIQTKSDEQIEEM